VEERVAARPPRALVAGWFSFEDGHATAGDLLTRDVACEWLDRLGLAYDVAVAPPFTGGVDWRAVDPEAYSHVIFVCGPFERGELEAAFLARFAGARLVGLNLSMREPLERWSPFDLLIERDSSRRAFPDLAFLSSVPHVPVVGVCLVEEYEGALVTEANAAVERLVGSRELAVVAIDTRLDANATALRTPAEVESLVARMDAVVTTRLHGMVLALKNGVPALAIDPAPGGAKIVRQAETIEWPVVFAADTLESDALEAALDFCLSEQARERAHACRLRAERAAAEARDELTRELREPETLERSFSSRTTSRWSARAGAPLVSVVIPCCNQARFLGEAIESVSRQIYPAVELIVVDDGSTDETCEVALGSGVTRLVRQPNRGLPAARNAGLHRATGEYVVFLDADDRLLPEAVEAGVEHFTRYPDSAFVSGHYRYIGEDGSFRNECPQVAVDRDPYVTLLRGNYVGAASSAMFRRAILAVEGGFDESLRACEDYDLYLRLARTYPIAQYGRTIAEYRQHGMSMSQDARLMLTTVLGVLGAQHDHVAGNPDYDAAWREGRRLWIDFYGEQLIASAFASWSAGTRLRALGDVAAVARRSPLWCVRHAVDRARRLAAEVVARERRTT
jgi:hypothetical protein